MSLLTKLKGVFAGRRGRVRIEERFDILGPLAQGSMSTVLRARDRRSARTVALKILDKEKTAQLEARFTGRKRPCEGAVAVTLRHPNIVRTFDHGVSTKGEQFLAMELIEGQGLHFLVETKSAKLEGKRLDYLLQAARAVQHVHEQNYIHRDVCPRNLLIDPEGVVKLIDFGLAVPNTPEFRAPGNRTGTYMAPELVRRRPTDERIDVFSFAVTAYNVFTGAVPWEAADSLERYVLILNSPPRDIRERRRDLDDALAECLMKGIERDPARRWQSMREFLEALEALPKNEY